MMMNSSTLRLISPESKGEITCVEPKQPACGPAYTPVAIAADDQTSFVMLIGWARTSSCVAHIPHAVVVRSELDQKDPVLIP